MKLHVMTKVALLVMGCGFGLLLISQNISHALWSVGVSFLVATPFVAAADIIISISLSFSDKLYRMIWIRRQYRHWGTVLSAIGFILLLVSPGPDDYRSGHSLETTLILASSGITLMVIGWIINHWPSDRRYLIYVPTDARRFVE